MGESGFGRCLENVSCLTVEFGGGVGLIEVKGNIDDPAYQDILSNAMLPTLWEGLFYSSMTVP